MMEFSKKGINSNIISCNRVILLHGPPGTGKTSLCKALSQKLCVQMADVYRSGVLIEINSHSLFSKWFSEVCRFYFSNGCFQKFQSFSQTDRNLKTSLKLVFSALEFLKICFGKYTTLQAKNYAISSNT